MSLKTGPQSQTSGLTGLRTKEAYCIVRLAHDGVKNQPYWEAWKHVSVNSPMTRYIPNDVDVTVIFVDLVNESIAPGLASAQQGESQGGQKKRAKTQQTGSLSFQEHTRRLFSTGWGDVSLVMAGIYGILHAVDIALRNNHVIRGIHFVSGDSLPLFPFNREQYGLTRIPNDVQFFALGHELIDALCEAYGLPVKATLPLYLSKALQNLRHQESTAWDENFTRQLQETAREDLEPRRGQFIRKNKVWYGASLVAAQLIPKDTPAPALQNRPDYNQLYNVYQSVLRIPSEPPFQQRQIQERKANFKALVKSTQQKHGSSHREIGMGAMSFRSFNELAQVIIVETQQSTSLATLWDELFTHRAIYVRKCNFQYNQEDVAEYNLTLAFQRQAYSACYHTGSPPGPHESYLKFNVTTTMKATAKRRHEQFEKRAGGGVPQQPTQQIPSSGLGIVQTRPPPLVMASEAGVAVALSQQQMRRKMVQQQQARKTAQFNRLLLQQGP